VPTIVRIMLSAWLVMMSARAEPLTARVVVSDGTQSRCWSHSTLGRIVRPPCEAHNQPPAAGGRGHATQSHHLSDYRRARQK